MKISVALCTYNGTKFLSEQLQSIIDQTHKVDEIVVCDDRSTDDTVAVLKRFSNENPGLFRIFINETTLKSLKNFEKAISLCTGDLIFLSDQDDVWGLDKVEGYVSYFNTNQNISVIASNGYCLNQRSEVEDKYSLWDVPQFLRDANVKFDYFRLISCVSNIVTGATMAIRKEFLPEILPFPVIENYHHDEWIALMASNKNSFELLDKKYFYYRIHDEQQVGGVFFDKTADRKKELTELYDIYQNDISKSSFKKRIKKLSTAHIKYQKLQKLNPINSKIYQDKVIEIEKLFFAAKKEMKKRYPISYYILHFSDKMFGKRQLTKISD